MRFVEAQLISVMLSRFSLAIRNECKVKTKGLGDVYMSNSLKRKKKADKEIKYINESRSILSLYSQSLLRRSQSPTRANFYCYRLNVSICRSFVPTAANCSALCHTISNRIRNASSVCTLDCAKHKLDE